MTDLIRTYRPDLAVRGDGRTLVGIAVPFGRTETVTDGGPRYREEFARGAFARTITERGPAGVKLMVQHDATALPIGRAVLLREDAAGLYAELRVSNTRAGDDVLELVRDGALDGLSVGFRGIREDRKSRPGVVVRTEVALREISAVAFPAYDGARIVAVRSDEFPSLDIARRRLRLAAVKGTHHAD